MKPEVEEVRLKEGEYMPADAISPDLREKLRAPLAEGGVKGPLAKKDGEKFSKRNILSTINPAYIVERLNDCFGENGWLADYVIIENSLQSPMIVVRCDFRAPGHGIERHCFGGNDNPDRGDAYKGACSDALGKVASQIGIAADVYKGIYDRELSEPQSATRSAEKKFDHDKKLNPIAPALVRAFESACAQGNKTPEQITAKLASLKIKSIPEIPKADFDLLIKWALNISSNLTQPVKDGIKAVHNFKLLFAKARAKGIPEDDVRRVGHEVYKVPSLTQLTPDQFEGLLEWVESQQAS